MNHACFNRILVVDDSTVNLLLLENLLTEQGYTVYPASDGELALLFVRSTLPDLILLDIKMPRMDGYEVCRRLKADERTASIPIIFLSALEDERDKVKGFQAGGVDYITKPFQQEEMLARVRIHLRIRELTLGLEQEVGARTKALTAANKRLEEEIAERKQAEAIIHRLNAELEQRVADRTEQLEDANKELEAFAYSVSHDLRAPLRAIDGFSYILLEDYADKLDDEGKRLFSVIRENTSRMGQLIEDILKFSRSARSEMNFFEIDMEEMARAVFAELLPSVCENKPQLEIESMPPARGDSTMIHQVLVNLLSNALKFSRTRETPFIKVGACVEGNETIYYVKDNGVGFDMQYADKLFGVFQRLHTVNEFEGTGIGLAIVKRIVSRYGGRVWAKSKVNEGTTIYFSLPQVETKEVGSA